MKVDVHLYATLRRGRFDHQVMDLEDGATVSDLMGRLAIDRSDVGVLTINRRDAGYHSRLGEGDRVTIIPPLTGG